MKTVLQKMGKEYKKIASVMLDQIEKDLNGIGIRKYIRTRKNPGIFIPFNAGPPEESSNLRGGIYITVQPVNRQVLLQIRQEGPEGVVQGKRIRFAMGRNDSKKISEAVRAGLVEMKH